MRSLSLVPLTSGPVKAEKASGRRPGAQQPDVRVEGAVRPASFRVARGSGKRRQLPDVAHVVLYDDRRLESRRNLLEAEGSGCRSGSTTCRRWFWHCSWS